jgi:hypothetical protein
MLAGVGGQIGWLDFIETEQLAMAKPEKEAEDCASSGRNKEKPARFGHGYKAQRHESQNNEEADGVTRPLPAAIGPEGHEMLRLGIGRVLGGSDHQGEGTPPLRVTQ